MKPARKGKPADMISLAADSYKLWADSLMVIGLRTTGFMLARPGSGGEAMRMVVEKAQASAELAAKLAMAGPLMPEQTARLALDHYGRRVSANRRRLAKRV